MYSENKHVRNTVLSFTSPLRSNFFQVQQLFKTLEPCLEHRVVELIHQRISTTYILVPKNFLILQIRKQARRSRLRYLRPDNQLLISVLVTQLCPILQPYGPARLLCLWNSPGKNTEGDCHLFLSTQGSNLGLLHFRQILYCLSFCQLPVLHHLPKFPQIHVHQVSDAVQSSCPLSSASPPAFNLSQHQGSRASVLQGSAFSVVQLS